MHRRHKAWAVALLWATGAGAAEAEALPALKIDPAQVSVSGLSSGGFMAVQMHVAYSATFTRGAGIVAGGPFFCAEGLLNNATGRCMAHNQPIPVNTLVETTRQWSAQALIDPVETLQSSRVYLFSGSQDPTVKPAVMQSLQTYYQQFMPAAQITWRGDVAAGHAMVTDDFGGTCATTASPFINDCDLDLAGEILRTLHGPLAPRNDGALRGRFIEFDQTPFVRGHGMADTGWAYVPQACEAGATCRLHVAFHGCRQNTASLGDQYVRRTGFNRWADTNQMVVLYPQTGPTAINGCWDWWGYDSPAYARRSGPQMAAVKAMVSRLSGDAGGEAPASGCITATHSAHVSAGRAYLWWGLARAEGSGDTLGWWFFGKSTLLETSPRHFVKVAPETCR